MMIMRIFTLITVFTDHMFNPLKVFKDVCQTKVHRRYVLACHSIPLEPGKILLCVERSINH